MDRRLMLARPLIERLCALHGVQRLEVFGSAAGDVAAHAAVPEEAPVGEVHEPHDYDFIAVLGEGGRHSKARRWIGLADGLEAVLNKPVDLMSPAALRNPFLRQSVQASRIPLYEQPRPQAAV